MFLEYLGDLLEGFGNLLFGMSGHKAETDQRILGSHSRSNDGIDEDSFLEEVACDGECLEIVADEKRDNRGRGLADLKAFLTPCW